MGKRDTVKADVDGYVTGMIAADIGRAVTHLGGGRMELTDVIDFSVGVVMKTEIGKPVKRGDVLAEVYHNGKGLDEAKNLIKNAIIIEKHAPKAHKIAYAYVSKQGVEIY